MISTTRHWGCITSRLVTKMSSSMATRTAQTAQTAQTTSTTTATPQTATSTRRKVLIMGRKLGTSDPGASPAQFHAMFSPQIEAAAKADIELTVHSVDVEAPADDSVAEVRALLRRQHWDGVGVGFGIRGVESLTDLFERLVNAAVQEGGRDGGRAPVLMFPVKPYSVWETVARAYGVSHGEQPQQQQQQQQQQQD